MIKPFLYFFITAFLFSSCSSNTDVEDYRVPVITVYSKTLYEEDISRQIPFDASVEDSVSIRNGYINSWIERQLLVNQAELNLPTKDQDVSDKLEKYRNDLLIFAYQNQLLMEKLDTNVSQTEIQEYYDNNQETFGLADYILKADYVKLDSADKNIYKVKKWLLSNSESNREKLDNYCYMHSSKYQFDGDWMYLSQLLNEVPIVSYNKEKLLKNKKLIELYDNGMYYLVRIVDYKLKDGVSPLSMEQENIKRIILNNRKLEFLEKLSTDIYQNAKNQNKIEIHNP